MTVLELRDKCNELLEMKLPDPSSTRDNPTFTENKSVHVNSFIGVMLPNGVCAVLKGAHFEGDIFKSVTLVLDVAK